MQQSPPFSGRTERVVLAIIGVDLLLQGAETLPGLVGVTRAFYWAGVGTWLLFTIEWCLRIHWADDWRKYVFSFMPVSWTRWPSCRCGCLWDSI